MTEAIVVELESGTVICDARLREQLSETWFDPEHWAARGASLHTSTGRAPVRVLEHGAERWVLRHYHRGGFVAHFVEDHYLWLGLERSRAFHEWRLLSLMKDWSLPAPRPVAARVHRRGLIYEADIITRYIPDTRPLSAVLREDGPSDESWRAIGRMLRRFHDRGVDHPDLTAHNILLNADGEPFLVDFDSARIRDHGRWRERGIARLQRSLRKVALETGTEFDAAAWANLCEAYEEDRRAL